MKKEKDASKRAENLRTLLILILIVLLFLMGKSFLKTQALVGHHLNSITSSVVFTAKLLELAETDFDQRLLLETMSVSILDTSESLDEVAGSSIALNAYAEAMDDLAVHILMARLKYQDEDIALLVKEVQNIATAMEESGIKKIVSEEGYLYSLDSKGVKDMLAEIQAACKLEV